MTEDASLFLKLCTPRHEKLPGKFVQLCSVPELVPAGSPLPSALLWPHPEYCAVLGNVKKTLSHSRASKGGHEGGEGSGGEVS